jgi:hypothetical protein
MLLVRLISYLYSNSIFIFLLLGASTGRTRNPSRMAAIIEAEARNSDTERKKRRRKQKGKSKAKETSPISQDDAEYIGSLSSEDSISSDEGDQSDEVEISNKEVI